MTIHITENTLVTLHFSLSLSDGSVIDSTFDRQPAQFVYGDGQLPEGFQAYLKGMIRGQRSSWQVPPERAFGRPNPNNIQVLKRHSFATDLNLAEGLVIAFADANNKELPGVVRSFDEHEVTVDFNHPLAGKTLTFNVEICDVQAL